MTNPRQPQTRQQQSPAYFDSLPHGPLPQLPFHDYRPVHRSTPFVIPSAARNLLLVFTSPEPFVRSDDSYSLFTTHYSLLRRSRQLQNVQPCVRSIRNVNVPAIVHFHIVRLD